MSTPYPLETEKIRAAQGCDKPARVLITGGAYSGKSRLLRDLEDHHGLCQLYNGGNPGDLFNPERLRYALKSGERVLIDDLDRAVGWLSEAEEASLEKAIRQSPAHVICTSKTGALMPGVHFGRLHLSPLSREATLAFYRSLRPQDDLFPEASIPDVHLGLRALSGGRPDRIAYLADRLSDRVRMQDWEVALTYMADHCTPEDRAAIEDLSAGQRRVWAALAELARGRAVSSGEVARACRIPSGQASMFLKRLVDAGYAEVHKPTQTQYRYRVADPLQQAHYLVRRCVLRELPDITRELLARERERA